MEQKKVKQIRITTKLNNKLNQNNIKTSKEINEVIELGLTYKNEMLKLNKLEQEVKEIKEILKELIL
ncbi:hypothetical protein [Mycobacterium sp.]|uniref:hypothetical protein n=1 Tax=Mycobacterium sp. TaxID=1785 RepID=UPI003A84EF4B